MSETKPHRLGAGCGRKRGQVGICLAHHLGIGNPQAFSTGVLCVTPLGRGSAPLPHLLQRAQIPHIISTEQALPRQQLVPQRAMICILALPVVRGLPSLTSTSASRRECKRAKTRVDELEAYRRVQPCQGQAQNPEQIRRVNDKHTLAHSLPPVQ